MVFRFGHAARAAAFAVTLAAGGCVPVSRSSVASVGGEAVGARLDQAPEPTRVAALAQELTALGPQVSRKEAAVLAAAAVRCSAQLAESYDMVRPVELHNVMVNLGLRRGGLCFQMSKGMLAELRKLPLQTLELCCGVAWKGDLWNEHSCIVVTAFGQPFDHGVVLDSWRNAGRLRWAPVTMDHYPWKYKPTAPREVALSSRPLPASQPVAARKPGNSGVSLSSRGRPLHDLAGSRSASQ